MTRIWLIPVIGAVAATLVTPLPMIAGRWWSVVPPYYFREGIDIWTMQALWFTLFTVVAMLVGQRDTFLGLAVFFLGAGVFLWGGTMDFTHRIIFMFGAIALWAVRQIPASRYRMVTQILAATGAFQALYVFHQMLGYDFFWVGFERPPMVRLVGTIGTVDAATIYVAVTAPLMPWWLLPLPVTAVIAGHSLGAGAALVVGLLVRYRQHWIVTAGLGTLALTWAGYAFWFLNGARFDGTYLPTTVLARVAIWKLALADWWHTYPVVGLLANIHPKVPYWWANPIIGNGPWSPRIPQLQHLLNVMPNNENFVQAHNEWLQWGYEYGAVGCALLGGWLWVHRRMFAAELGVGAALAAGAVAAGSFFVFQVVGPALLLVTLVGLATRFDTLQEVA